MKFSKLKTLLPLTAFLSTAFSFAEITPVCHYYAELNSVTLKHPLGPFGYYGNISISINGTKNPFEGESGGNPELLSLNEAPLNTPTKVQGRRIDLGGEETGYNYLTFTVTEKPRYSWMPYTYHSILHYEKSTTSMKFIPCSEYSDFSEIENYTRSQACDYREYSNASIAVFITTVRLCYTPNQEQTLFNTLVGTNANAPMDPKSKAKFKADLDFIEGIQSPNVSELHRNIFKGIDRELFLNANASTITGKEYRFWIKDRIQSIIQADTASDPATHHLHVPSRYSKLDIPQIKRVSTLFHEARHMEPTQDYWAHVDCPDPGHQITDHFGNLTRSTLTSQPSAKSIDLTNSGDPACDQVIDGAYGVEMIFLQNTAQNCTNCSDLIKTSAKIYAEDRFQHILENRKALFDDADPKKQTPNSAFWLPDLNTTR